MSVHVRGVQCGLHIDPRGLAVGLVVGVGHARVADDGDGFDGAGDGGSDLIVLESALAGDRAVLVSGVDDDDGGLNVCVVAVAQDAWVV
jgi:hypothetical protein